MDPLAALPEAELRAQVLMQLSSCDKRSAALVCRAWHAAVSALPVRTLRCTTEQVVQREFMAWLRQPGRAGQVSADRVRHVHCNYACALAAAPLALVETNSLTFYAVSFLAQVTDFAVTSAQGCVGEVCMPVAEARRLLTGVTRYHDHVSQQASPCHEQALESCIVQFLPYEASPASGMEQDSWRLGQTSLQHVCLCRWTG